MALALQMCVGDMKMPAAVWVLLAALAAIAGLALVGYLSGAWDVPTESVPLPRPRPP